MLRHRSRTYLSYFTRATYLFVRGSLRYLYFFFTYKVPAVRYRFTGIDSAKSSKTASAGNISRLLERENEEKVYDVRLVRRYVVEFRIHTGIIRVQSQYRS